MRYVVRTVDFSTERTKNVLLLKSIIPELEVVVDKTKNAYNGFFDACRLINDTGGIILEDDILLCSNFKNRIENIITEKGTNEVFNFFEKPKSYFKTSYVGGSNFLWAQCIYLPPNLPNQIVSIHDQFKQERPKKWQGQAVDCLIAYALTKLKRKYWRIRPCLVQHLDFQSSIGNRPNNRQSPYFIDELEEKGIDYDSLEFA